MVTEIGEVDAGEDLAMEDGEVDLRLVEPGDVNGKLNVLGLRPASRIRSTARWPRWLLPLSTNQNTRRAEA